MERFVVPLVLVGVGVLLVLFRRQAAEHWAESHMRRRELITWDDMTWQVVVFGVVFILFGGWMLYVQLTV